MQREKTLDENILSLPETPKFVKPTYEKGSKKKDSKKEKAARTFEEEEAKPKAPKSPVEPAPKRKQEELKKPVDSPTDVYFVGEDVYPTKIEKLIGKRFNSIEEYLAFLNKQ